MNADVHGITLTADSWPVTHELRNPLSVITAASTTAGGTEEILWSVADTGIRIPAVERPGCVNLRDRTWSFTDPFLLIGEARRADSDRTWRGCFARDTDLAHRLTGVMRSGCESVRRAVKALKANGH